MIRFASLFAAGLVLLGACSTSSPGSRKDEKDLSVHPDLPTGPLLTKIGEYRSGIFDGGATEISAFDPASRQLYVTNGADNTLDILDLSDPAAPVKIKSIDLAMVGGAPNSVAVHQGLVAVAVENNKKHLPGKIAFFSPDGSLLGAVDAGPLPDMVTFSPDGKYVIAANEGQPREDYGYDPEGSVLVIDLSDGVGAATTKTADFKMFNGQPLDASIKISGPNATVAQDLEPEYIAVSSDSRTAWVTLQENNAIAVIDLASVQVTKLVGLGYKSHSLDVNAIDASNRDGGIHIKAWPVKGMYQPDAISTFMVNGITYLVTANEGDARDYEGFSEEARVKDLELDPATFPAAAWLQQDENLGRLKVTTRLGDIDGDGDYDELYAFGARSFSVWSAEGTLLYDSGDLLEKIMKEFAAGDFNSTNDENQSFDDRSDDKGPEPEGLAVGEIKGRPVLFLGLERVGGVMAFDLSDPSAPEFLDYINTRNFSGDPAADTAGDLAPEGLIFVPAVESPNGSPLLIVSYEVSGSIVIFQIAD